MKRKRKGQTRKKVKRQSGVLAFARRGSSLKLMLVTARGGTSNWVIPKGNVEKGMSSGDSAEKEAFEEAGIAGCRSRRPVAFYSYRKKGAEHKVAVFLLRIQRMHPRWDEDFQRTRKLFSLKDALTTVGHARLSKLIEKLPEFARTL